MRLFRRVVAEVFMLSLALMMSAPAAEAGETLAPGGSVRLNADGCIEENYRCVWPCALDSKLPCPLCSSSCDGQSANMAQARIARPVTLLSAEYHATSSPYSDFVIEATTGTTNDPLVCAIDYDVEWAGSFAGSSFLGNTGSEVLITLELKDMTTGDVIKSDILHRMSPELGIGIKGAAIGFGTDRGEARSQTLAMVRRGHSYRVSLRLDLESWAFNIPLVPDKPSSSLDYMTAGQGAWWNLLRVTLEKDPEDLIANHGHTYLTGRGAGHNNAEAVTGVAIFFDDSTDVSTGSVEGPEGEHELPQSSTLRQSFPNPGGASTTLGFSLPEAAHVTIRLFDIRGREVMTLVDEERAGGDHEVVLDASRLTSGVYFYRLSAGPYLESRKLVIAR